MKTTTSCPPPEELQKLLDGSLSGERQVECTDHLDSCECCQAKLEQIATGGSKLSEIMIRLNENEPMATSAYWPALKALGDEGISSVDIAAGDMPSGDVAPGNSAAADTPPGAQATGNPTVVKPTVLKSSRPRDVPLDFLEPASDSAYLGRMAHFDVMRILGRGGMGLVLEAFDSKLQRHVALKVLDPEFVDDDVARQRFCREARAAASITHENVVAVHQVERSGEAKLPYLVMQLIHGGSLEDRLDVEKQLPVTEVVRIGMQAAHGLAAAHAQGLIHRDIKPGNILLEAPSGRVKLTDFGLARVAEDVKLTRTGYVSGTPLYMAPEQAMGLPPDPRSDLFSLGAILYEMCAGQPPFDGDSPLVVLKKIAEKKHRPVRELNPAVPEWLSTTIDRLLTKKPADRIQTAAQLAELLEFEWALMKTTSEDVPTICVVEQRRQQIRNRWIAAAIGTAFLAVGLLAGMFMAGPSDPNAVRGTAEPVAVLSANGGAAWSVSFSQNSKTVAMGVEDGTVRLWDLATKTVTSALPAHRGVVWSARFAPGGDWFATAGDDGLIKVWKPGESDPFKTFAHPNAVRGLALGHDNKTLYAGGREGGLRVWSLDAEPGEDGKTIKPVIEAQVPGAIYAVAISPHDETLATAGSDKVVRLWSAKTLSPKLPLEGHAGPVYGLSFHPDGRHLASVGWDHTVRIWDIGSGQLHKSWEGHSGDIWGVAYSPDGTKLATGGHDGAVKLWNPDTGELLATFLGHRTAIHGVSFNSDGTLLGSAGRDGAVRVWKVE